MISKNRPQIQNKPALNRTQKKSPFPNDTISNSMVASYDDVFGFSDDEDAQKNGQNGVFKSKINTDHLRKPSELKSSNGIIVLPQSKSSLVSEPKAKLKQASVVQTSSNASKNGVHIVGPRKLVAVMPPKPPTFSTFQTLPTRKPMISAPKPQVPAKNFASIASDQQILSKKLDLDTDCMQNGELQGRVKAMRQVFATLPNPIKVRPPIPLMKDYHDTKAADHEKSIDQYDQKSMPVLKAVPVLAPISKAPAHGHHTRRQVPCQDKIENSDDHKPERPIKPISANTKLYPLITESAPVQPPPPPLPMKSKKPVECKRMGEVISESIKSIRNHRTISSSTESGETDHANGGCSLDRKDKRRRVKKGDVDNSLLNDFVWFHGDIDRQTAELRLLQFNTDGSFLIRYKSTPSDQSPYSLSVFQNGKTYHLQIRRKSNGSYALGDCKANELEFIHLHEIVSYHRRHPLQLIRRKSGELAGLALLTSAPPKFLPSEERQVDF